MLPLLPEVLPADDAAELPMDPTEPVLPPEDVPDAPVEPVEPPMEPEAPLEDEWVEPADAPIEVALDEPVEAPLDAALEDAAAEEAVADVEDDALAVDPEVEVADEPDADEAACDAPVDAAEAPPASGMGGGAGGLDPALPARQDSPGEHGCCGSQSSPLTPRWQMPPPATISHFKRVPASASPQQSESCWQASPSSAHEANSWGTHSPW